MGYRLGCSRGWQAQNPGLEAGLVGVTESHSDLAITPTGVHEDQMCSELGSSTFQFTWDVRLGWN